MPDQPRVIITDLWTDDLAPERSELDGVADIVALGARGEKELDGRIGLANAVICNHEVTIGRQTIDQLENCLLIVRCGVGFENIDHRYAAKRGIAVANVPDYGTEEVADSAIALMLALGRGVNLMNSRLRSGLGPWNYTPAAPLIRLRGAVMGIVGFGSIGMATALRARAFGMDVAFYDPHVRSGLDKVIVARRLHQLDDLFDEAHVVSLHCTLTEETRHMIDAGAIAKMRRGALLINTARGALVDTAVIPDAIMQGQLGGAAFDVVESDSPTDEDPLVKAWRDPNHPAHHRVIINPHIAFYSEQSRQEMRIKSARACRAALLGEAVPNVVNGVRP